jgi:hypothetical protein
VGASRRAPRRRRPPWTRPPRLGIGPLDRRDYAEYHIDEAVIVVGDALAGEDPRAVAAVLAHVQQQLDGPLTDDTCATNEAWARVYVADVWQALTGGELPSGTRLERDLTRHAALVREKGVLGLYGALNTGPEDGRSCVVGEG